jgi:hypothetical protein
MYRGAMTFTIWERAQAPLDFAYRRPPHRGIVKTVRSDGRLIDSMFIRCEPYAATGTWPAYSRFAPGFAEFARGLQSEKPVGTAATERT